MTIFKTYLDTSIISAYFDFRKPVRQVITQKWFQYHAEEHELFASTLAIEEIHNNTDRELMLKMLKLLDSYSVAVLEINDKIFQLAKEYRAQILPKEINDTLHIATASVYEMDAIVSWNFKHIVNLKTMKAIHRINTEQTYPTIEILTLENLGGDQYGSL
ncbi:MAG: type II toxin-antitoxin system VapC family toxin [bacterium]|nr:type II toxin-antitoxin system VapC family toxin [bacterium]